jgi:hypothetical protein
MITLFRDATPSSENDHTLPGRHPFFRDRSALLYHSVYCDRTCTAKASQKHKLSIVAGLQHARLQLSETQTATTSVIGNLTSTLNQASSTGTRSLQMAHVERNLIGASLHTAKCKLAPVISQSLLRMHSHSTHRAS